MKRLLVGILAFVILSGIGGLWYVMQPLVASGNVDVYIPRGSSVSKACQIIDKTGIVRFPRLFNFVLTSIVRLSHGSLYSGAYRFTSQHTHLQLLRAILSGKQALKVRVTFPEGITAARFASLLHKNVGVDSVAFMRYIVSDSLIRALGIESHSLEGYLMPDTYEYYWKQPPEDIIESLVNQQTKWWKEKFESQALSQGKSRHEVLTLASIVEAETPMADERPRVAGVYTNRLNKGMRLEADPTVQFAIGGDAHRVLLSDLDVDSDYNTYRRTGLPPGPINAPGLLSIEAALQPEKNSYLFFCAKGDGSNTHSFAVSSAEHRINVLRYRKNRRLNSRH